jgi:hypothetical protein
MSFTGLPTTASSINNIEISSNGKLCVFFGNENSTNYVYYSNDFDVGKTFNKYQITTTLPSATCSTSYTYNGIYYLAVFYIVSDANPTFIPFFTIKEDGTIFYNNNRYIVSGVYKYTAISFSVDGEILVIATQDATSEASITSFKSGSTPLTTNTAPSWGTYTLSPTLPNTEINNISCSYTKVTQGFFTTNAGSLYNYYNISNTIFNSNLIDNSSNFLKLSNIGSSDYFYAAINNNTYNGIYLYSATFNSASTIITPITGYGTQSTGYTYTNLRMYNSNIYIFSSNEGITFSINGTPTLYSTLINFTWCALGYDTTSDSTSMVACRGDTYIYYLDETICFLKNTKITILENDIEIEKQIELLQNGDLVKTNPNEYHKINFIGHQQINTLQNLDHLRVLPKNSINENLPYEDLYLTSGHSLLFPDLTHANEFYNKDVYTNNIEGYYKIMTQHCSLCKNITTNDISNLIENDNVTVYHFSLESDDPTSQYAIYSNGIRSECMSYEFATNKSNMRKYIL